jgi:hypothetical protein
MIKQNRMMGYVVPVLSPTKRIGIKNGEHAPRSDSPQVGRPEAAAGFGGQRRKVVLREEFFRATGG